MDKNFTVGFLLRDFPVYSETFVLNQINGLIERGFKVKIYTLRVHQRDTNLEIVTKNNLMDKVTCLDINDSPNSSKIGALFTIALSFLNNSAYRHKVLNNPYSNGFGVLETAEILQSKVNIQCDALIAHFGPNAVLASHLMDLGVIDAKLYPVFHGFDMSKHAILERNIGGYKAMFEKNIVALPISDLWKNKLIEMGCPENKIHVNRMGVDITQLEFTPKEGQSSPLHILTVARHTDKKGIEYAIRAMAELKSANFKFDYKIFGDGPLVDQHKALVNELGLEGSVHILGLCPPNEIKDHLAQTDIFLLPSVTPASGDMEGVPVSLMEAMAKGVVCLSTYHSGIPELIENEVSGFLVDEKNSAQIAASIQTISSLDLTNIRLAARQKVETLFNQSQTYNELAEILNTTS